MSETDPGPTANFCGTCGNEVRGAAFCMKCGTKSGEFKVITPEMAAAAKAATAPEPPTEPLPPVPAPSAADTDRHEASAPPPISSPPPPAPRGSGGSGRNAGVWIAVGGAVAAMIVVALVLVFVIFGGDASTPADANPQAAALDTGREYQEQVAEVFGPVLGAHQKVSQELDAIKASKPQEAQRAVRQAQQAATEARGALRALKVPDGQEEFAAGAQEVMIRQDAYLAAVQSVLSHPTVAGASNLQTLSSNLTAALTSAGPAVAGDQEPVSGATRLTAWARTTSRRVQRQAAAKKARAERRNIAGGGSSSSGSGSSTAAAPRGNSCGDGVYAGPNTSCTFALMVRDAYWEAPGSTASVRVYSPVTDETYTMNCRPSGSGITCAGGNNASVTF